VADGKSIMHLPPESISTVTQRPNWTVTNGHATFAPVSGGWRAIVSLQRLASTDSYHVAIVDRTGAVRFTMESASLEDALRNAERGVLVRNALRLAPRAERR
jgi:hypothetical protein